MKRGTLRAAPCAVLCKVSSNSRRGHLLSPVIFDDLHFSFRPYDPLLAYGQSKTAAVLLAVEASARWMRDGIFANAAMPGAIATQLQRHTGGLKTPPERQKGLVDATREARRSPPADRDTPLELKQPAESYMSATRS